MSAGRWAVTSAGTYKRIHRADCRYAKRPYEWANKVGSETRVLAELKESGAVMWHLGCRICCPELDTCITRAQAAHVREVVLAHIDGTTSQVTQ